MAEKGKKGKHRGSSGKETPTSETTEDAVKKPSMKTATDVISRLLWDDSLPAEKFTVGYLDRFEGIMEKPFESLDWQDPAIVDNYTLALPKHRIVYFKYRNRKVWDKSTRKDFVFGSTGSPFSINEFMALVDQERLNFQDEGIKPLTKDDSECEDNVGSDDEYDVSDRANFFIAARISNEDSVKKLRQVSDYMISREDVLEQCSIKPEMYHLTLSILKLDSPDDIMNAVTALKSVASRDLPTVTLHLEGLDNFRHRVLYSRVEDNKNLMILRNALVQELTSNKVNITDKFTFVPHVTVVKLNRPVTRLRNSKYLDQYLYLKFEDNDFGCETIDKLYLCEMGDSRREDGFYRCACEMPLTSK
ncbi:uncharacterized protein LOC129227395 [Uloborus diversus]|uniref:uncharacterized protein LOC129227395 n=1 Tax=Uloborus diversus TaxID=327109 RepID=UPI002409EB5F|nr:uncharacterized protein LOC129227395 [Uloborus diversus]